jgi:hypothetical protein
VAAKPDGKNASDRFVFTRPAAERISKVVRLVEGGDRDSAGLTLRKGAVAPDALGVFFRVCTFTGAWSINSSKTVTLKYQTTTPNTVSAINLYFPFPTPTGSVDCAIAREGTSWFLIDVPMETATAVFASATDSVSVVTGITVSATLNTSTCDIAVSVTQSTSAVTFVTSTFTASFLQFKVS